MEKHVKVALYARVSTVGHNQDPEMQLRELREYASRRGWQVHAEYVDHGISGKKEKRPSLDRLMVDAKRRKFDAVAVWRFDRFARSTKHLLTALEEFKALGIQFVSYQEAIDTATPMGQAMFTIIAAISALEADIIRERIIAGLAHAKAKGKKLGRKSLGVQAVRIHALQDEGLSLRQIATKTGWSLATITRTLKAAKDAETA
jgi:DNA invertase Pin-like site-specific DNA recombinase